MANALKLLLTKPPPDAQAAAAVHIPDVMQTMMLLQQARFRAQAAQDRAKAAQDQAKAAKKVALEAEKDNGLSGMSGLSGN